MSIAASPTVSVVIPLFNKAAYVVAAIQSVLAQRRPALEVIVVDDGSTDDGAARVLALGDPRVRLVSQPNGGVSSARNHGIELATGDLVAFLDADDLHHPDYLETVMLLSIRFPAAGMLCTGYSRVDAAGQRTDMGHCRMKPDAAGLVSDFYGDWSRATFTSTISITVRRRVLLAMPQLFPLGERLGEDQDLWFRLAERTPVAYSNRPLADYRVDVAHSATQGQPVLDMLPCYQRLSQRLAAGQVPVALRKGARRLLACHLINLARARARKGRLADAALLLRDSRARGNPLYWLRSVAWLTTRRLNGETKA